MALPLAIGAIAGVAAQQIGTVLAVIIGQTLSPALLPLSKAIQKAAYNLIPNELIPVVEAIEARYRGIISPEQYEYEVRRQGFDDERQEWVFKLSENLLGIMELISLYRRGVIPKATLLHKATKVKWGGESIEELLKVTEAIPSATDIIAFAVREVYSPDIAEAFGQFEGLDEVFEKAKADILAIGMTKETFGKYWAAHWMLPSVGQGFEMLHRGVIPEKATSAEPLSLERLMVALDIMPAWKDKLTAISYSPFTRVDVRRMHKIGVLGDADLIKSYMDLGYDEEKAGKMAEFTILYNYEPPIEEETEDDKEKAKQRDLTKTDILNGYRDALLEDGEARYALTLLGYDPTEVEYYIARINYNKEKDETDSYLKYYHDAYIRGIMTHNELVDKLNALNLPGARITYLFGIWDLERMARTTKPTKAELMTFFRKKIITINTWTEEMKGLGYPERYIEWYQKAG